MLLSEEQMAVRDTARRFAQAELAPYAQAWDEQEDFPAEVLTRLAQMGFMGMLVPQEKGGTEAGHLLKTIVAEEIAAGCGAISTVLNVHDGVCAAVAQFGTHEQAAEYLPAMLRGELIGAFCLTEPGAGSDTAMLKTRATRVRGGWRLDGTKSFISNGRRAGLAIVVAITDPGAGTKGFSQFLVPTGTEGFFVARVEKKMGQRCSDTAQIVLDGCVVHDSQVLGPIGNGYAQAIGSLPSARIAVAAQSIGMARSAYEAALEYARHRKAFGQEIIHHQAVAFRLADMLTQIEVARQYTHHAASLVDSGLRANREASIAKCFASEMAERVASAAIQTLGGTGYMSGPVERIARDVRVCQIYEGTSDIQRLLVSRDLGIR
ncbi:acyl-CoA dehydrogenase family protein [Xenophilus aerolatus]|nr:acyl-CoA dehydrogenase family protein [Xenophilus aerolatus]